MGESCREVTVMEGVQVRIHTCNPATPNLNPFHNCDFPTTFPHSIPLLTLLYSIGECSAAFLQLPRPLGCVSPSWDCGPGGRFRGSLTHSVDLNRYNTRCGVVELPTIAT